MVAATDNDAANDELLYEPNDTAAYSLAAGAEGTRVARQPRHDAAQLVRPADSAHGVKTRPLREQVRLGIKVRCGHAEPEKSYGQRRRHDADMTHLV